MHGGHGDCSRAVEGDNSLQRHHFEQTEIKSIAHLLKPAPGRSRAVIGWIMVYSLVVHGRGARNANRSFCTRLRDVQT